MLLAFGILYQSKTRFCAIFRSKFLSLLFHTLSPTMPDKVNSFDAAEHERRLHQADRLTVQELPRLAGKVGHVDFSAILLCINTI